MKSRIIGTILLACLLASSHGWAQQKQKPPADRVGMDPGTRNKVAVAIARGRINPNSTNAPIDQSVVSGPAGKSCTTTIGNAAEPAKPGIGGRFGPGQNKEQIIVVQGPIINVCK